MINDKKMSDKLIEKIYNNKRNYAWGMDKEISSISLSYPDYYELMSEDPIKSGVDSYQYPPKFRGYKIRLNKKITRLNFKWSDQRKFSNRHKKMTGDIMKMVGIPYHLTYSGNQMNMYIQPPKPINFININVTV